MPQIAFGYLLCFLIMRLRFPYQVAAAAGDARWRLGVLVPAIMWYACYWLYQRKIFFKI